MITDDLQHETILPYNKKFNYYTQIEGLGRYLFALDFLQSKNLKTVLDVGCYNGFGCSILAEKAENVYGIDISKKFISQAKKQLEKSNQKNIAYAQLDIAKQDIVGQQFDLITCFDTLAHIDDEGAVIDKLYNLLSDDGYLVVSLPHDRFEPLKPNGTSAVIGHKHFYTPTEAKKMFTDKKFVIEDRLGQAISNVLLNIEHFVIRKYEYPERQVKSFYNFQKDKMRYFARLIAYPNIKYLDDSYTIVLVLKKGKKK